MSRCLAALACLWAVVLLVPAASSSKSNEVGGQAVSVSQAPWAVLVASSVATCTGSLIDPTHVVTAAHCEYDENHNLVPPSTMTILAGASDYRAAVPGDVAQWVPVASYRIHPAFVPPASGVHFDDVAVLTLATPVTLGPGIQTIALPPANASLQTGESAQLFGFGQEAPPDQPDGHLYELGLALGDQSQCSNDGSDDAVWICASAPAGAPCYGDSGGGLVVPGATPVLVGVAVWVHQGCPAGSVSGFANLLAPEIGDFVRGDDQPPTAPRLSARAGLSSDRYPDVGTKLMCTPGVWTGSPTYAYTFVDASTLAVLQAGPLDSYVVQQGDVGRSIVCIAAATNDGGTGVSESDASPTIESAPEVHASPVTIARGRSGTLVVALAGPLDQGSTRVCAVPPASVAAASCVTVRESAAGVQAAVARVPLKVRKTARVGRFRIRVSATYPDARAVAGTAFLNVRR